MQTIPKNRKNKTMRRSRYTQEYGRAAAPRTRCKTQAYTRIENGEATEVSLFFLAGGRRGIREMSPPRTGCDMAATISPQFPRSSSDNAAGEMASRRKPALHWRAKIRVLRAALFLTAWKATRQRGNERALRIRKTSPRGSGREIATLTTPQCPRSSRDAAVRDATPARRPTLHRRRKTGGPMHQESRVSIQQRPAVQ